MLTLRKAFQSLISYCAQLMNWNSLFIGWKIFRIEVQFVVKLPMQTEAFDSCL